MRLLIVPPPLVPMLALLVGCGGASQPVADGSPYQSVPYEVPGPTAGAPEFDADAMSTAITDALSAAVGITGAPVLVAYTTVMATADDTCPNYYENEGNIYWYDQCTTESGSEFSGYSFYYLYDNFDAGDGNIYNGAQVYGVAQMWDAEGHELELGGSAANLVLTAVDGSYTYWYSVVQGSFAWDGAGTEGTWVTPGMAPDVVLTAVEYPAYDARMFYINGGISGLGGAYDSVVFDGLTLYNAGVGDCPEEPGGMISVRDASGYWYDMTLDGQIDTAVSTRASDCDGCAAVWYQGQEVGEVCADYTFLTSWEGAPW